MKSRLAVLALVATGLAAPAAGSVPASYAAAIAPQKTCGAGYVHASLSWGEKCLHAGEFGKVSNREYTPYGFSCPSTGHLRRR
jgi:hypothetical protein